MDFKKTNNTTDTHYTDAAQFGVGREGRGGEDILTEPYEVTNDTNTALGELWKEFVEGRNVQVREKLILHYAPLVKFVAGRVSSSLPKTVELDDLTSQGMIGLISAVDNFNPSKGVKFESYASIRIRGTIIDSLRENDWLPRTLRDNSKSVNEYHNHCAQVNGEHPTDEETAKALNLPLSRVQEIRSATHQSQIISLNSPSNHFANSSYVEGEEKLASITHVGEEVSLADVNHYGEHEKGFEAKEIIEELIGELTEDEKIFIALRYYENYPFSQIGEILNYSETSCNRKHRKILEKLKNLKLS